MGGALEKITTEVRLGNCVLGYEVERVITKARFSLTSRRILEIEKLVRHRGPAGPDVWVRPMADHLVWRDTPSATNASIRQIVHHVVVVAPWLGIDYRELSDVAEMALNEPKKWSAAALGRVLLLGEAERIELGIRSFRFVGQTKARQAASKLQADRERQTEKRRQEGKMVRADYVRLSVAEEARREGVSRQAIYKRRAKQRQTALLVDNSVADIGKKYMSDARVNQKSNLCPKIPIDPNIEWLATAMANPTRRSAVANAFATAAHILSPTLNPRRIA